MAIILVLLANSCHKDESIDIQNRPCSLISEKILNADGTSSLVSVLGYSGNRVTDVNWSGVISNSYKIFYNDANQIIEVHQINSHFEPVNASYSYDSHGLLASIITNHNNGEHILQTNIVYNSFNQIAKTTTQVFTKFTGQTLSSSDEYEYADQSSQNPSIIRRGDGSVEKLKYDDKKVPYIQYYPASLDFRENFSQQNNLIENIYSFRDYNYHVNGIIHEFIYSYKYEYNHLGYPIKRIKSCRGLLADDCAGSDEVIEYIYNCD